MERIKIDLKFWSKIRFRQTSLASNQVQSNSKTLALDTEIPDSEIKLLRKLEEVYSYTGLDSSDFDLFHCWVELY